MPDTESRISLPPGPWEPPGALLLSLRGLPRVIRSSQIWGAIQFLPPSAPGWSKYTWRGLQTLEQHI